MKNKNNSGPVTLPKIAGLIKASQEELALMMGKSFEEIFERLTGVDLRIGSLRDEMINKFDFTNRRIDDLTFNRVKYDDHVALVGRVDKLESEVWKKKVK